MVEQFITFFIFLLLPIPLVVIGIHILIKYNYWKTKWLKLLFILFSIILWMFAGYVLYSFNDYLFRERLTNSFLQVLGFLILLISFLIEVFTQKALGISRIFGNSEFKNNEDELITSGIYKYARHPRYIEHPLWSLGLGLFFGYTFLIWFFLYLLVSFMIVAYFEEQELINRYGAKYIKYKKDVPAFFLRI